MKSPFPGMDPYLERRWGDVHTSLCVGIRSALQPSLPTGLRARAQEDVLLQDSDGRKLAYFEPDVSIVETEDLYDPAASTAVALATRPILVRLVPAPKRRRWVEIIDTADSNRVVTAIEILSPGNKESGTLNHMYRKKVEEYLAAGANIVEIDLLRSSRDRLAVPIDRIPENRRAAYYTCVCRATKPSLWLDHPMPLRRPLGMLPIPCRERDADVPLELQPVIDRIYLEGGHDDLDYSQTLEPPLAPADAEWAAGLVSARNSSEAKRD